MNPASLLVLCGRRPRVLGLHRGSLPLLMAVWCSVWLLSIRWQWALRLPHPEDLGLWAVLLYFYAYLLALPLAFAASVLWSTVHLARVIGERRLSAVLPLAVNVAALAIFLTAPFGRITDTVQFHAHRTLRQEVVDLIESGQLWNGSPLITAVSLPPRFPRQVSNGGGQRTVTVFRGDGALHVVFYPGSDLLEPSGLLYRSDGKEPSLPNEHLPTAIGSEPLAERWHRVLFRRW